MPAINEPAATKTIIVAEFTVEPFEASAPGPHVLAAIAAAESGANEQVEIEIGPFGTAITGPADQILALVDKVNRAAVNSGASRVSLQISSQ